MKNLTPYYQFLTEGQNPPNPQILQMIDKAMSGVESATKSSKGEYLRQALQMAEYPLRSAQELQQALVRSSSSVSTETMNQLIRLAKLEWRSAPYGKILGEYGKILGLIKAELGDAKPLVNERAETKVAGPIDGYYIYNKGGKFYIYQTNASQKTPILMQGTLWSNNGQGYNTQDDADAAIQLVRRGPEEMGRNMDQHIDLGQIK